jgi:hypothetical protein
MPRKATRQAAQPEKVPQKKSPSPTLKAPKHNAPLHTSQPSGLSRRRPATGEGGPFSPPSALKFHASALSYSSFSSSPRGLTTHKVGLMWAGSVTQCTHHGTSSYKLQDLRQTAKGDKRRQFANGPCQRWPNAQTKEVIGLHAIAFDHSGGCGCGAASKEQDVD